MKQKLPRIYFLHIPKTAGSSVAEIIRCAYPQEQAMPAFQNQELLKLKPEDINKYKCYTGHFGTGLLSLLDNDISCVTMLRDPFERAVSLIKFSSRVVSPSDIPDLSSEVQKILIAKGIVSQLNLPNFNNEMKQIVVKGDLHEIVNHPYLSKMIENTQTLYLGHDINLNNSLHHPNPVLDWSHQTAVSVEYFYMLQLLNGLDTDKIINNAKKRLDEMAVVGIVEHFNDSIRLICDHLGIKQPKNSPERNISPEKHSLKAPSYRKSGEISTDIINRIDELTSADQEIYEYGKKLFLKQLRNKNRKFFWPFQRKFFN